MKLNRTTLVLPLAGLLVVAGASAVLATGGSDPAATDGAVVPAVESPSASAATDAKTTVREDSALVTVLDDLVAKGTITESQKQAIVDGVAAERAVRQAERKAAREAAREQRKANIEQLRTFLADGVITQQEFDQLPENSRLRQLEDLLSNGGITTDELKALGRGFGMGKGPGLKWFGGAAPTTPDASASPSTGS
jgi:polyhydroxyalkanoate synthesis regulator phasin